MYHYIYMTPNVYKQLFNETASLNTIFIKTDGTVDDETLSKQLMDLSAINSVTMNSTTEKQISSVMNSLLFIVVILIVAAGLLAFVFSITSITSTSPSAGVSLQRSRFSVSTTRSLPFTCTAKILY